MLTVAQTGPCTSPCPGMASLGQFSAWGVRATNFGQCLQDFARCGRLLLTSPGLGLTRTEAQTCCQERFNQCARG